MRRRLPVLFALLGLAPSAALAAQSDALARADSLFAAWDVAGALAVADSLLAADSLDAAAAWRAARARVLLGVVAPTRAESGTLYRAAIAAVEPAVARDSTDVEALYWLAGARGRLALSIDGAERAVLTESVWELAHRVLALDPDHAGAHNALGTLNHEVRAMPRIERFLARRLLGRRPFLEESSWDAAERHHRQAVRLDPESIRFRYDLALTLMRRGRRDEAAEELRTVLDLRPRYLPDPVWQDEARRTLARLERRR